MLAAHRAWRADELYTADPTKAMHGEPEPMCLPDSELRERRERHDARKAEEVRQGLDGARLDRRVASVCQLAREHRVNVRDETRLIATLLDRIERQTRRGEDPGPTMRRVRRTLEAIELRVQRAQVEAA